ncbi:MAG: helix-turn-helix transcriptional regulator [Deltaproteobacteria bacterium]|nr:helix-turn-helix transcriptional regulator [Deltaproteobacteria bacterium]
MRENNLKTLREGILLSKTELARKAGVSPLTIDRIEKGYACRVDTMRKILHALGLKVSDRGKVFGSQVAEDKVPQEKPSHERDVT